MWRFGRPGPLLTLEMDCPETRTLITCELGFFLQSCMSGNFKQISKGTLNIHEVLCTRTSEQMNYSDSVIFLIRIKFCRSVFGLWGFCGFFPHLLALETEALFCWVFLNIQI